MDLEDKKYFSECRRKRIQREISSVLGFLITGLFPPLNLVAYAFGTSALVNVLMKGYDDLMVGWTSNIVKFQPWIKTMNQTSMFCKKKTKEQIREIQNSPSDVMMVMTEQILLLFDKEKKSLQDKKTKQVVRKDGTKVYTYKNKFETVTHSSNIGTLIQLHEMGYIDISSIKYTGNTKLIIEKFMAETTSFGILEAAKNALSRIKPSKDTKVDEYEDYEVKFHLTSKPIDFDEIIETMSDKEKQKQLLSKEMDIDYLNKDEKKLPDEKKSEIIESRKKRTKNNTKLAARLIRKGLALVSVDGCRVTYVKEGSKESILSKYQERKEKEEKAKSWMEVENYQENERENAQQMDKNTVREEAEINNKQATEIEDEAKPR